MKRFASKTIAGLSAALLAVAWPVLAEGATDAFQLQSVQVRPGDAGPAIRIDVNSAAAYRMSHDAGLTTLHLDLADTRLAPDYHRLLIDASKAVKSVEARLLSDAPQAITRVDIMLNAPHAFTVTQGDALTVEFTPLVNADAIEAFKAKSQPLRLAEERAMARAYVRTIARTTAADASTVLQGASNAVNEAEQRVTEARSALLALELASDADNTELENGIRETVEAIQKRQAEIQSLDAKLTYVAETAIGAINSADAASIQTILAQFDASVHAVADRLERTGEALNHSLERARMMAASAGQRESALAGGFDTGAGMSQLDRELSQLHLASAQPAAAPKTAQPEFKAAPEHTIALALTETEAFAALKTTDVDSATPAPPMKRTEPVGAITAVKKYEQPEKMAVLRAGEDALREAEDNGRFRMAQAGTGVSVSETAPRTRPAPSGEEPRRFVVPRSSKYRPDYDLYNPELSPEEDPLQQLVDIDFKDMNLTNVVELLAQQAQINVIAGTELDGKVTAELKNIPLGRAFEIVLRLNGLGIVEEAGVYRITTYEEAIASRRETSMVFLRNAQAEEVAQSLNDVISLGTESNTVSIAANASTNVVIVSGPRERVQELESVVAELDVADQVIPTVTVPLKLNYTEPAQMLTVVEALLSESGKASADHRGRHIIVTDIPIKVEEIEAVIESIDIPVKQVYIESMVVDALMEDNAETGVEWLLNSARAVTPMTVPIGGDPMAPGSIPRAALEVAAGDTDLASALSFGVVSGDIELSATIAAQIRNQNAELLANPNLITVENQPATINITTEFPFQERTQTDSGGQIASTEFKEIGTILTVTPRVTHEDDIVATLDVKESTVIGFSETGVPIEAKRKADTTIRVNNGETIYIGGLRSTQDTLTETKVPFLGDVPVVNTLFKSTEKGMQNIELLVFLTCEVLPFDYPELTPYEKTRYDKLGGIPMRPQGEKDLVNAYLHPERSRDPFYKWRRAK